MGNQLPPYPWDDEHPPGEWPNWIMIGEVNQDAQGDSVYADTIRHCTTWRQMKDRSKTTTAHECTHGINNQIRNTAGASYDIEMKMGSPSPVYMANNGGGRVNACYVLGGRAIILPEPPIRKRDVANAVPKTLRGDRFSTYITGQGAWDAQPLYIFDEWSAYINGAKCGIDMFARGESPEKTDLMRGPLEFSIYALALMTIVPDPKPLLPFFRWQWLNSWATFRHGKDKFPFSGQDEYAERFFGLGGQDLRAFAEANQIETKGL